MKVSVKYEQEKKFVAEAGSHQIVIDLSKEKGGSDSGMSPLEVFLSALGGCVAVYSQRYCQGVRIDVSGLTVEVEANLSQEKPFRFTDINISIHLDQDIGDRKEALLRFARNCPLHHTIHGGANIEISLH